MMNAIYIIYLLESSGAYQRGERQYGTTQPPHRSVEPPVKHVRCVVGS